MAVIEEVVAKLIEKTDQDKVRWRSTSTANTFMAAVDDWNLTVSSSHGSAANYRVRLRISDQAGQPIEEFSAISTRDSALADLLAELHERAKCQVLGSVTQLDDLLAALG